MKKLIFAMIALSLMNSVSFANGISNPFNIYENTSNEITLFDGRKIDLSKEVERVHFYGKSVDFLELTDGEIVDRTDIKTIQALFNDKFIMARIGVDGGG